MNTRQPPEVPKPPRASEQDPLEAYHRVTDTVGGPNIRVKDNLVQGLIALGGGILGAIAGLVVHATGALGTNSDWYLPVVVGAIGGLIIAVFISGLVLMVLGWVRASRKK